MRIGYACLTIGVPHTDYKTCLQSQASEEKLRTLIQYNLESLKQVILYNIQQGIRLFRISSDVIPFGSSPVNPLRWWEDYHTTLSEIGVLIQQSGMRVSLHPGQYTVLNSPKEDVVEKSIADLDYHAQLLDSLGLDYTHKLVLHVGGVYQDKAAAMKRFIHHFQRLSPRIQRRLIIENDDKSYSVEEVLSIASVLSIPVVFDNLHHFANPSTTKKSESEWIEACRATWKADDGPQKIHYSEQAESKRIGSHSATIHVDPFLHFRNSLPHDDLDIMLEVKDKNLSAIKIQLLFPVQPRIALLEQQWSLYKYSVLEKSQWHYESIREVLKQKASYPAIGFYRLLEQSLELPMRKGQAMNALQHVYGYLKKQLTDKEKNKFLTLLEQYDQDKIALRRVKRYLESLFLLYPHPYIQHSYYFLDNTHLYDGDEMYG